MKQLEFQFHVFCTPEQHLALNWFASDYTEAEKTAGNREALSNPTVYMNKVKDRFSKDPALVEKIHEDWVVASAESTLNKPIWPKAPVHVLPKRNVITLGAAS